MKMFSALILMAVLSGCTNAELAKNTAYGTKFKVTLYSEGVPIKTWISTGKVETEAESDGWFFVDETTNKLIRISGTVTIEQM